MKANCALGASDGLVVEDWMARARDPCKFKPSHEADHHFGFHHSLTLDDLETKPFQGLSI